MAAEAAIFINYRHDEMRDVAGRLADALSARFGENEVFLDVGSIEGGTPFDERILETIDFARAVVALIGLRWLVTTDETGHRRLDDPRDWVRLELEQALKRGVTRVVPVLVDGAPMPSAEELPPTIAALASRQAMPLRYVSWKQDVVQLSNRLEQVLKEKMSWEERSKELSKNLREPSQRRFYAPSVTNTEVGQILVSFFETSGMRAQILEVDDGQLVQARTSGGLKRLAGLATSLDVLLRRDGEFLLVQITPGKWGERAAVGAASLIYLPLAAFPAFGAYKQAKLPQRAFDLIEHFLESRTA